MHKKLRLELKLLLLLVDFIVISALFYYFLFFRYDYLYQSWTWNTLIQMFDDQYKAYFLLLVCWVLISEFTNLYGSARFVRFIYYISRSLYQLLLFSFILYTVSGIKSESLFTNKQSILFVGILGLYIIASRTFIFYFNKAYFKKGYNSKNLIIVGNNDNTSVVTNLIHERKNFGLILREVFDRDNLQLSDVTDYLAEHKIDYAYICLGSNMDNAMIQKLSELFEDHYITVGFIPDTSQEITNSMDFMYLDSFPIQTYKKYPLDNSFNQILKRLFDVLFSLLMLVLVLWWLLPLLAVVLLITQGYPIIFVQRRNGLNGKEFDCYKFRTMRADRHNNRKPTEKNDPRVTKFGKILRVTSLDELPQFFNVLKGDMSVVGPRPHMVSENESYSEVIKRYALRYYVKPGITGLAQIRGYRGAIECNEDMEMRIRTDIYYVRNWSFLLDMYIIYRTVRLMIVGDENAI
ncbi:MAG TPA: exopolysaccharide biosynthesis polyprenyl glycosylphosphotransferase [Saprospiraceae bacterium]|nr:exopolysaccharide biosynthesis polyprenyl glycosylphosphotransferase [Saprospiraceae bacterium]